MTAFFIPGITDDRESLEEADRQLRTQIQSQLGSPPSARRIFRLWTREGRADWLTEVGRGDSLRDGIVIAIFDMGPDQPFVVCRQQSPGPRGVHELLERNAYSVLEFDA